MFIKIRTHYILVYIHYIKSLNKKPKKYSIVAFDVYGDKSTIQGIRTDFTVHDVAWSYMKQYKKSYPLYNFALVTDELKSDKKTIFRYI